MTIRFPKLRFPTFAEVLALFHVKLTVDGIVADIRAKVDALEAAALHHQAKANDHFDAADAHEAQAGAHTGEAIAAASVAANLSSLITPAV